MATFTLPNQGDEPWDLNPAINAINDEVEQTTDLVTTGRLSASSLSSSFATAAQGEKADAATPANYAFELVPATQYGDSWGNNAVGSTADITSAFAFRVCSRLRTNTLTDRSVSATRSDQIQQRIAATWTAPGRGVVFIADNILNDAFQNRNTVTYKEATKSSYIYLSARNISTISGTNFQFGPGWINGVSSTAGAYVDVAGSGTSLAIVSSAGTTGGVFQVRAADGTIKATVNTGGWSDSFGLTTLVTGLPSGNNTLRVEVVSGTVTLIGAIAPSATPPVIIHNVPGNMAGSVGTVQNSKLPPFRTAVAEVAANFPNVVLVQAGSAWDPAVYLSTDETHLNDAGNSYVASRVIDAIKSVSFRQGLNRMVVEAAYVAPAPAFNTPTATVPATVTGVTATAGYQANISWAATTDGGSTLTGYVIQASTDGTTYTDVKTVASNVTSTSVSTGLTPGTNYTFKVVATNANGRSTASAASASITAGPVLTVYSADPLTGSGAMGNAQTGGQAWTAFSGTAWARNANGTGVTTAVTDRGYLVVNDGQSDGVLSLTIGATGGTPGLVFRMASDFTTGYMFWNSAGSWTLSKQTALGSRSNVVSPVSGAANANDVLSVVLSGSSIICKVNGTTVLTATDSTYTGTRHGLYSYSGSAARFLDWQHTS